MSPKKRKYNKNFKIYVTLIICIILILLLAVTMLFLPVLKQYMAYRTYSDVPDIEVQNVGGKQIKDKDFLTAAGSKIVNEKGETVILQGVNLGGWLLQEYWMCPVYGDSYIEQWTHLETLQILKARFGETKARELMAEYEENWITEWDIKNIAAMGCNVIRVPFGYWNFMSDANGTWLTDSMDDNPGFQTIDWLIEVAGRYGVYVILDMHGCPGGQSYEHCSGSARSYELFRSETYQKTMEILWIAIAQRYKDDPVVAAYDIMNEPQIYESSIESDPRNLLYDRMIKAIRTVDPDHIITVEGIWDLAVLPDPKEWGWDNVMYQVHQYGCSDVDGYCKNLKAYSEMYSVPIYVGEFSDMNMLESCRKYGLHFSTWTYKGTAYADGTWYMYYTEQAQAADIYKDPYWLIKLKWGKCLSTQFFEKKMDVCRYWNT